MNSTVINGKYLVLGDRKDNHLPLPVVYPTLYLLRLQENVLFSMFMAIILVSPNIVILNLHEGCDLITLYLTSRLRAGNPKSPAATFFFEITQTQIGTIFVKT